MVNGNTWPYLDVEQRRYRFRFLNACNARTLILKLDRDGLPFWQIGSDGGFLPRPARLTQLLMGPAERADVIVDFTTRAGRHDDHAAQYRARLAVWRRGPRRRLSGGRSADDRRRDAVPRPRVAHDRSRARRRIGSAAWRRADAAPPTGRELRRVSLNELDSARSRSRRTRTARSRSRSAKACGDPNAVPFGPCDRAPRHGQRGRHGQPAGVDGSGSRRIPASAPRSGRSATSPRTRIRSTSIRRSSASLGRAPFDPENPGAAARTGASAGSVGDRREGHRRRLSRARSRGASRSSTSRGSTCGTATSSITRITT